MTINNLLAPWERPEEKRSALEIMLVRLTKEEIRLLWSFILPQGSEEYGDLFQLDEFASPYHTYAQAIDQWGNLPYVEWMRRAARYANDRGLEFHALRFYKDGRIEWKTEEGWRCEPNLYYAAAFAGHMMPGEETVARSIEFAERKQLDLPYARWNAFLDDMRATIDYVKSLPYKKGERAAEQRKVREALKSIGIRVIDTQELRDLRD